MIMLSCVRSSNTLSRKRTLSFLSLALHATGPSIFSSVSLLQLCDLLLCWHPSKSSMKIQNTIVKASRNISATSSFCIVEERMSRSSKAKMKASKCTSYSLDAFPAFHQHQRRTWKHRQLIGEMFRYKILTVQIGRQENSFASSKSPRPSSGLNVCSAAQWSSSIRNWKDSFKWSPLMLDKGKSKNRKECEKEARSGIIRNATNNRKEKCNLWSVKCAGTEIIEWELCRPANISGRFTRNK